MRNEKNSKEEKNIGTGIHSNHKLSVPTIGLRWRGIGIVYGEGIKRAQSITLIRKVVDLKVAFFDTPICTDLTTTKSFLLRRSLRSAIKG